VRWNQAGYAPGRPIRLVLMSDADLAGVAWQISTGGAHIRNGEIGTSVTGAGDHTPFKFNHVVEVGSIREPGEYKFEAKGGASALLRVIENPHEWMLPLPIQHLRVMRSGSHDTLLRGFSHPGDARAQVFVPDPDTSTGKWRPAEPVRTVDALGGWYDAGDQIKFTLNQACTVYHLLLAYRLRPELFGIVHSKSELPDILDEARHGLEFLMRVHPDPDTFIIQVGDAEDHNQGMRLPENDRLDGHRPALCALSRVHMAAASAALALGARTFQQVGRKDDAARYAEMALKIHDRALKPDTVTSAFERDDTNDFYHDPDPTDQMAVAALELHALTGLPRFLDEAKKLAPPPAAQVGWADWNWVANAALAAYETDALQRLMEETAGYVQHAREKGAPWDIPSRYVWGSLARWVGIANAVRQASLMHGPSPDRDALFWSIIDYTFGRNNWGVSFLFSERLPNTVRNIYSPTYRLLGVFPTGALSEGPGGRATHERMSKYFTIAADDPFHRFNTPAAVFFDNSTDFMCQEATITAQADLVLMLTLATMWETKE